MLTSFPSWAREDPDNQTFWKRARDFADCVTPKNRFALDAALKSLMGRVADQYAKNQGYKQYVKTKVKPDDLRKMELRV